MNSANNHHPPSKLRAYTCSKIHGLQTVYLKQIACRKLLNKTVFNEMHSIAERCRTRLPKKNEQIFF